MFPIKNKALDKKEAVDTSIASFFCIYFFSFQTAKMSKKETLFETYDKSCLTLMYKLFHTDFSKSIGI